jgi:DUF971 family protein
MLAFATAVHVQLSHLIASLGSMSDRPIPVSITLKRDSSLTIDWGHGQVSVFPLNYLRAKCPCASCKQLRESQAKSRLTVLPSSFASGPVTVKHAEKVGNYAIRIDWSDNHGSGIYSFTYLKEITPPQKND